MDVYRNGQILRFLCHIQVVEYCIKLVTEELEVVCEENARRFKRRVLYQANKMHILKTKKIYLHLKHR